MAKSEEPHLPADGQCGAVSAEAACQVLCGASPDSAGTDKVFYLFFFLNHADVFGFTGIPSTHLFSRLHLFVACGERRLHGMSHCCGLSEHDLIAPASDAL